MDFTSTLSKIHGVAVFKNHSMKKHTGYGVGGNADYFIKVLSLKGLADVIEICSEYKIPYKIIGNGTNILVSDKGYKGVVINTKNLSSVSFVNGKIHAMCGALLSDVICFAFGYGLYGGEPLKGIPATVGGAITMNASAFGCSVSDFIDSVDVLEKGKIVHYEKQDCDFSYRHSRFMEYGQTIASADFCFGNAFCAKENCKKKLDYCNELRKSTQPKGRSCGSVFKNPTGDYAGRLIEKTGLKGYSIGGAMVSDKHANFIVAKRNATATDIYNLIKHIQKEVYYKQGVKLNVEIETIGDF